MQNKNYKCIPIKIENNNIILACSRIKIKESFANTTNNNTYYGVYRQRNRFSIYYYNPLKIYKVGDIVVKNLKGYLMYNEALSSGDQYGPPNKTYYIPIDYQNEATYIVGDIVNGFDGSLYVLVDAIGKSSITFAPPNEKWQKIG